MQIVMISGGINIITFVMEVGFYHSDFLNGVSNYRDMILADFHMVPYLLKEIVFFYYVLLRIASVNSLYDSLIQKINAKCWQLKMSENKDIISDYVFLHVDASSLPIVFKLGSIEVRQNRVLITLLGFCLYCMSILMKFRRAV
jgi:hypothetical protein